MKRCDRQEELVGYLYEEIDQHERRAFDAHLAVCAECRIELEGLRSTRTHLTLWAPPEPDLGFRLIRGASAPAAALPRRRWTPAFAFAAAAVIVLAVAAAIANVELRYDAQGLTVRTGWQRAEVVAAAPTTGEQGVVPAAASFDTTEFERRLGEIERRFASQPPAAVQSVAARPTDADILRQVRALIEQAESRQRLALAQGLMQVINDVERQRGVDLAMFEQGDYQHRLTNAELQQTRDLVQQFIRSAASKQDK